MCNHEWLDEGSVKYIEPKFSGEFECTRCGAKATGKTYLFNVETSWEVFAPDEDTAYEWLDGKEGQYSKMIDQDVMLVSVED